MSETSRLNIEIECPAEEVLGEIFAAYHDVTKAALEEQRLRELASDAASRLFKARARLDELLASASGDERRQELTFSAL